MNFRKSGLGMMNASLTGMNRIGRVRKFRIQNSKVREDLDNLTPNTYSHLSFYTYSALVNCKHENTLNKLKSA